MLPEDHIILPKVLLGGVAFQSLHGDLILKELFSSSFEPLLLNGAWNIAFLEDAAWDEHIVVDSAVQIASTFSREQESVEIVLVLLLVLVGGQVCVHIHVDHGCLTVLMRTLLQHRAETVYCFFLALIAFRVCVVFLELLNSFDKLIL
jgi:hypothetical protein